MSSSEETGAIYVGDIPSSDDDGAILAENKIGTCQHISESHRMCFKAEPSRKEKEKMKQQQREAEKHKKAAKVAYNMREIKRRLLKNKAVKFLQVVLAVYIAVVSFAGPLRDKESGFIIDTESEERTERGLMLHNGVKRAVIANSTSQLVFLAFSRLSAYFMYPPLVLVYFSKLRATVAFLASTPVSLYVESDMHELHVYCGTTILVCGIIHTIFHLARWADQGNLNLVYDHFSGVTGLIIVVSLMIICLPMMSRFKQRIRYEIRKNAHYIFLVFGITLIFHSPKSAVPNGGFAPYVFTIMIIWYILDAAFCMFCMTEKIETTKFDVLPTGVQMTMQVSSAFQKRGDQGGFCYVCLPWVDKNQWHAFSLFESPSNPAERQIFMQKGGDWTSEVHKTLQRDTVRPVWVQGPFPSPYDHAPKYDNQVLVASGIGITPALSVLLAHRKTRQINLVWVCKDKHLLEFFLPHLCIETRGWQLIFYTGRDELDENLKDVIINTNVAVIEGRPDLPLLIPNLIFGVETGRGLPKRYPPSDASKTFAQLSEIINKKSFAPEELAALTGALAAASFQGLHIAPALERPSIFDKQTAEDDRGGLRNRRSTLSDSMRSRGRESTSVFDSHLSFKPWEDHVEAIPYIKGLEEQYVMSTWGILYCGAVKPIRKDLLRISDEYKIDLHIESFGW